MQQTLSKSIPGCEVFNRVIANLERAGHLKIDTGQVLLIG